MRTFRILFAISLVPMLGAASCFDLGDIGSTARAMPDDNVTLQDTEVQFADQGKNSKAEIIDNKEKSHIGAQ